MRSQTIRAGNLGGRIKSWSFARSFLAVFIFLFMIVGNAGTSQALKCKKCHVGPELSIDAAGHTSNAAHWVEKQGNWLKMFGFLGVFIDGANATLKLLGEIRDRFVEKTDLLMAVKHVDNALAHMEKKTLQRDKKLSDIDAKANVFSSKIVGRHTANDFGELAYCNNVTARKGPAIVYPFTIFIENTVTAANEALFLGSGADGDGPYYAAFGRLLSCPSNDPNDPRHLDPRTGLRQMEYPEECLDEDDIFEGADITARIVTGEILELMMPPFVDQEVTLPDGAKHKIKIPKVDESLLEAKSGDPANADAEEYAREAFRAQKAFMAGWKYCVRAMGSRMTPPAGSGITTAQGIVTTAGWHHCASVQSNFIRACAKMLAKHTKPNCAYSDEQSGVTFDELCTVSLMACDAAKALDATLPFNCRAPLSLYEAEYASHMACFAQLRLMGDNNRPRPNDRHGKDICSVAYEKWQTRIEKEKAAFVAAQEQLASMRDCWPTNQPLPVTSSQK